MATLNSCRYELSSILNELRDIQSGIRRDFSGIGQDMCADSIGKIIEKYEGVQHRLNRVDQNRLAEFVNGEG